MPNEDSIQGIIAKACGEVLQERAQEIAEAAAHRIGAALALNAPQGERTKELRDGTTLIACSRTQTETLETLLAACSAITPACGLLILRGAQATGWSCHQLTTLDNFKRATMDCSRGPVSTVISSGVATSTRASELDPVFTARLGLDSLALVLLVPVLLKERVAALLLAVSSQNDDLVGLELLVQVAQLSLDLQAYRKVPQHAPVAEPPRRMEPARIPVVVQPEHPVAITSPAIQEHESYLPAATPTPPPSYIPAPEPIVTSPSLVVAELATTAPPALQISVPTVAESAVTPQPSPPVLDEAHERARRFAKLLVEEIKLYNQTKVAEGRVTCDLYSRLHDDIEKSRAAYHKRYGETVRDVDYFTQELMRILADNNLAVMGAGFPS